MPIPAFVIDTASLPALQPRASLLTVATGPMEMPAHMETSGGVWEPEACTGDRLYPVECSDSPPYPTFTMDPREAMRSAYSFAVYASEICTPVGTSAAEAERRARNRLRIAEQVAVETALWGGGAGVTGIFERMQAATQITAVPGSPGVVEGLSLLEQTASELYDGQLIIHARPRMAAYFANRGLFDQRARSTGPLAEIQRSHFGSLFSLGSGYSGNSPTGTPPNATDETVYATGRVLVWRSPDVRVSDPNQVLDRTTNQRGLYAVRIYSISVECVAAAARITRAS